MKKSIHTLSPSELTAWMKAHGQPAFRAKQVGEWVMKPGVVSFSRMENLPKSLREALDAEFCVREMTLVTHQGSPDGPAEKFLLELSDGQQVETVLLHNEKGEHTVCVSTQVGCGMGCVFCASGMDGVARNLTACEILEQFLFTADHISHTHAAAGTAERLSHAVIMGMGEPLANLEALLAALEIVSSSAKKNGSRDWSERSERNDRIAAVSDSPLPSGLPEMESVSAILSGRSAPFHSAPVPAAIPRLTQTGLGIGARKITISTVGLPVGIRQLADSGKAYHLAVSLHAAEDTLRNELIPANRQIGIRAVLDAAGYYFEKTGRRVTYEYILLAGVNDSPSDARRLAALLHTQNALVNLIPFNPVSGLRFQTPSAESVADFAAELTRGGISCVVRHRKGEKLDAACGQLRRKSEPRS